MSVGTLSPTSSGRPKHVVVDSENTELFTGELITVGTFDCPPSHPRWTEPNCIGPGHHVVFPQTAVRIAPAGGTDFVTGPTDVVLYDPEQEYRRHVVSEAGDRCTYLIVREDQVARIVTATTGDARRAHRFPTQHARLSAPAFLRSRQLQAMLRADAVDPLGVEETALELVGAALGDAVVRDGSPLASARQRRDVRAVQELLAHRFTESLSLADIGREVGASPYHLARGFRLETGWSIHEYRVQLRVRTAVDRLTAAPVDLARLALDLGFSSHSHLTDTFRRIFGAPPSAIRSRLAA
jgi:AraC family transcriptional regulator